MKKFTIYNLQFTIPAAFLLYILNFTLFIPTALAVDSTPSADVKTKLEQLKKEIASKAAKLKQEVNQKLQNRAYMGNIKVKSENSLTLASNSGPKIINVNQDTIYQSNIKKSKSYSYKNLSQEDYIAALGDTDDTGVLTAKKVVLLSQPKTISKLATWGQVLSISDKLITIKNKDLKNISVSVIEDTNFKKGNDEIALFNLKINDFVIISGVVNKNDILGANFVYVLPQGFLLKPKTKPATPSAKPGLQS